MKEDVPDWFGRIVGHLAEGYSKKLTEAQVRLYWAALKDLTPEQVRHAAGRAVRESEFFPSVAFLRKCVGGSVDDQVTLAWATARRAAADVGAYATVAFDDGAIATAIEMVFGTWDAFCRMEEGPELHARRQEFLAAYRTARAVQPKAVPRTLRGLCEVAGTVGPTSLFGRVLADGSTLLLPMNAAQRRLTGGS